MTEFFSFILLFGSALIAMLMFVLRSAWLALLAFAVVWLFTAALWRPFFGVVNRRGNHWWTDAWNPIIPVMGPAFWGLLVIVVISAVAAFVLRKLVRIPLIGLIAMAIFGFVLLVFLLVTAPVMKWWMWLILFTGAVVLIVFRGFTPLLRWIVGLVFGSLLLLFALIAADWSGASGTSDFEAQIPKILNQDDNPNDLIVPLEVSNLTGTSNHGYFWDVRDSNGEEAIGVVDIGYARTVRLTFDTAGAYTVRVRASNRDDTYTEYSDTLRLTVGTPVAPPAAAASTAPPTTPPAVDIEDLDEQAHDYADAGAGDSEVYTDDEIVVTTEPDLDQTVERGSTYFCEGLNTHAQLVDCMNGTGERNIALRDRVADGIRSAGYGEDEVARAFSGECYSAVMQLEVDSQIYGNTWFEDGQVFDGEQWREVKEGDFFWLCVAKDGTIIWEATLRGDCANPDLVYFKPIREETPEAPPAGTPSTAPPTSSAPPSTSTPTPTTSAPPTPTATQPPTTRVPTPTPPAPPTRTNPPTSTPPEDDKNHTDSPVGSNPTAPDERTRPNETTAPPTVIRPSSPAPRPAPSPQPTLPESETPPEVQAPVPAGPSVVTAPPATGNPADNCDKDGDGFPDDSC